MNQLIRDLQINLILDNPNPIIDTFNGIWNELSVIETNVYHEKGESLSTMIVTKNGTFIKMMKMIIFGVIMIDIGQSLYSRLILITLIFQQLLNSQSRKP